jgi:hypothetical protein
MTYVGNSVGTLSPMYARSPAPESWTALCCLGPGPVPRAGLGPSFLIRQADAEPGVSGIVAGGTIGHI